jgi:hypothetical protein
MKYVLGLLIPKKRVWSEFFFRLSRGVAGGFWTKFEAQLARKLKLWLQATFEPTWCTSYSKF